MLPIALQAQKACRDSKAVLSASRCTLSYVIDADKLKELMHGIHVADFVRALKLFMAGHPPNPGTSEGRRRLMVENLPDSCHCQVRCRTLY